MGYLHNGHEYRVQRRKHSSAGLSHLDIYPHESLPMADYEPLITVTFDGTSQIATDGQSSVDVSEFDCSTVPLTLAAAFYAYPVNRDAEIIGEAQA